MNFILWIDDEPSRANLVTFYDATIIFAHGFEQINYYLNSSGIEFKCILLDHDMPLMNGMDVVNQFLIEKNYKVFIVTNNYPAGDRMFDKLEEYAVSCWLTPITKPNELSRAVNGF